MGTIWTPTPMSPVRRAFFLASIMFGVLVVAMFLWALPCDVQPCETQLKLKPRQWFTQMNNIGVNYTQLVEKVNGDLSILISFYAVDRFVDTSPSLSPSSSSSAETNGSATPASLSLSGCGLAGVDEKTGKQGWRTGLQECPRHIDCQLLDGTGDGLPDCLILGHTSMALLFEPIYGTIFWHVHIHVDEEDPEMEMSATELVFDPPIVLQDLNEDGFPELLFPVGALSPPLEGKSRLVLVCGRSGAILGRPFPLANCVHILHIFREDFSVGYTCTMENRSELTGKLPLTTVVSAAGADLPAQFRNETPPPRGAAAAAAAGPPAPEANDAVCQVRYENRGECPFCKAGLDLGLAGERREFEHAAVVAWRVLATGNACRGAVVKMWKWDPRSLQEAFLPGGEEEDEKEEESSTGAKAASSAPPSPTPESDSDDADDPSEASSSQQPPSLPGGRHSLLSYVTRDRGPLYAPSLTPSPFPSFPSSFFPPDASQSSLLYNPPMALHTTATPTHPTLIAPPPGYRLQKLEEVLFLLWFNGSDWVTRQLGSMAVYQLCLHGGSCLPSHLSQKDSILVDVDSLRLDDWSLYVSSSSFSSVREDDDDDEGGDAFPFPKSRNSSSSSVAWSLESYVRKLITPAAGPLFPN